MGPILGGNYVLADLKVVHPVQDVTDQETMEQLLRVNYVLADLEVVDLVQNVTGQKTMEQVLGGNSVLSDLEVVDPVQNVTGQLVCPEVPRLLSQGVQHRKLRHSLPQVHGSRTSSQLCPRTTDRGVSIINSSYGTYFAKNTETIYIFFKIYSAYMIIVALFTYSMDTMSFLIN
jgi:hypothetical protein